MCRYIHPPPQSLSLSGTFFLFSSVAAAALVFGLVMLPETRGKTLAQVREMIRVMMMMMVMMMMICIQINRMFYTDPLLNLARVRAVVAGLGRGGAEEERHRNIYTPSYSKRGHKLGYTPCRVQDGADKMVKPRTDQPDTKAVI